MKFNEGQRAVTVILVAPSQERELKLQSRPRLHAPAHVAPSQERELKFEGGHRRTNGDDVAPSQERELKFLA